MPSTLIILVLSETLFGSSLGSTSLLTLYPLGSNSADRMSAAFLTENHLLSLTIMCLCPAASGKNAALKCAKATSLTSQCPQ